MHANLLKYFVLPSLETISHKKKKKKKENKNLPICHNKIVSVYYKTKKKKKKKGKEPTSTGTNVYMSRDRCPCVCVCLWCLRIVSVRVHLGRSSPGPWTMPLTTNYLPTSSTVSQQQQRDSGWTRMDILRVRWWRSSGTHSWAIALWASPTDRRAATM